MDDAQSSPQSANLSRDFDAGSLSSLTATSPTPNGAQTTSEEPPVPAAAPAPPEDPASPETLAEQRKKKFQQLEEALRKHRQLVATKNMESYKRKHRAHLQKMVEAVIRPMYILNQKKLEWRKKAQQMAETYQRLVRGDRMKRGLDRSALDVDADGVERFQLVYEGPVQQRLNKPGKEIYTL